MTVCTTKSAGKIRHYVIRVILPSSGYVVTMDYAGIWRCSCPAWIYQRKSAAERKPCKHILKVQSLGALQLCCSEKTLFDQST